MLAVAVVLVTPPELLALVVLAEVVLVAQTQGWGLRELPIQAVVAVAEVKHLQLLKLAAMAVLGCLSCWSLLQIIPARQLDRQQ